MQLDLDDLHANYIWKSVVLLVDQQPINYKWVFKVKLLSNGGLDKYKAQLVVKGFFQQFGVYFNETFGLVVKTITIRIVITLTMFKGWKIGKIM